MSVAPEEMREQEGREEGDAWDGLAVYVADCNTVIRSPIQPQSPRTMQEGVTHVVLCFCFQNMDHESMWIRLAETNQWFEGMPCDMALLSYVEGEEETRIAAHRSILAAYSPFFASAFKYDTRETSEGVLRLAVRGRVLHSIYSFCYTGEVTVDEDVAIDLLIAADMCGLEKLTDLVCSWLLSSIRPSNVMHVWLAAARTRRPALVRKCATFVYACVTCGGEGEWSAVRGEVGACSLFHLLEMLSAAALPSVSPSITARIALAWTHANNTDLAEQKKDIQPADFSIQDLAVFAARLRDTPTMDDIMSCCKALVCMLESAGGLEVGLAMRALGFHHALVLIMRIDLFAPVHLSFCVLTKMLVYYPRLAPTLVNCHVVSRCAKLIKSRHRDASRAAAALLACLLRTCSRHNDISKLVKISISEGYDQQMSSRHVYKVLVGKLNTVRVRQCLKEGVTARGGASDEERLVDLIDTIGHVSWKRADFASCLAAIATHESSAVRKRACLTLLQLITDKNVFSRWEKKDDTWRVVCGAVCDMLAGGRDVATACHAVDTLIVGCSFRSKTCLSFLAAGCAFSNMALEVDKLLCSDPSDDARQCIWSVRGVVRSLCEWCELRESAAARALLPLTRILLLVPSHHCSWECVDEEGVAVARRAVASASLALSTLRRDNTIHLMFSSAVTIAHTAIRTLRRATKEYSRELVSQSLYILWSTLENMGEKEKECLYDDLSVAEYMAVQQTARRVWSTDAAISDHIKSLLKSL